MDENVKDKSLLWKSLCKGCEMGAELKSFVKSQILEINKGGLPVLARKLRRMIREVISVIVAPAILLFLFILRPFILIRVGSLRTDCIGHLALNYDLYLCERDAGLHPSCSFDIFFPNKIPVCNEQLVRMWKRRLPIHRSFYYVYRAINLCSGFEQHLIDTSSRDRYGILHGSKLQLSFTREEAETGNSALVEMGLVDIDYVCINARDKTYKETTTPKVDWSYHDYNNMDINTYIPAIESMVDIGYSVVRMGSIVKERCNISHPKFIDYATNGMRSGFLDIYLPSKCCFFISNGTGIDSVSRILRKPILYVNVVPLEYVFADDPQDLFIPKKLWMRSERRFMTFQEILESGVGRFLHTHLYEENNLEIVYNTPEEIEAATREMHMRLKGSWKTAEEDDELQKRFWLLFKPSFINRNFRSNIGTEFLRQNRDLLD